LVADGMIGVVGMQAFDARDRSRHSTTRPRMCVAREQSIPLSLIASVRSGQLGCKDGIDLAPCLHPSNFAPRFKPRDPLDGQRTGKPVVGGKRSSILEQGRYFNDYRQAQVTRVSNSRLGPQRSADLGRDLIVH
jgi:hypothetical protein